MGVSVDMKDLIKMKENIEEMFSSDNMYELANDAVNFYVESFNNQGFTDITLIPWDKSNKENGYTLVLTGQLRNSIHTFSVSRDEFSIISDMEYSEIHNEGGMIYITEQMRKYFWAMFSKTGDDKWKWLALTKLTNFTIPKRQFMGESKTLNDMIEDYTVKKFFM